MNILRSSISFRVPHLCSKIPKIYHWSMASGVHGVCFRGDFAIKTVVGFLRKNSLEKCVTRWSISFILLVADWSCYHFVHWVCTGVQYEPRQCSLFWDYIPESEICFCTNLHRLSSPHAIRRIVKLLNCQTTRWVPLGESRWAATKNSALALSSRNNMISIQQRSAQTNEGKITLILSYCVMNGFIRVSASCSWRPLHWRIRQSHLTSRRFHSIVPWWP